MKKNKYPIGLSTAGSALFLCFYLFVFPVMAQAQRQLVWEENFNGTALNPQFWTYETGDGCSKGNCGWGNQELEYYTNRTANVRVEGGNLVIEAKREDMGGKPFTSGRIKTAGRLSFRYGALEARIKVPKVGNGLWPAFWMLGATGGTWPHNGEIDIMEIGSASAITAGTVNKLVRGTSHWWANNPGGYVGHAEYGRDTVNTADLSDAYHLYRLEWDPLFITVFLDNAPYYKIAINGGNGLEAFHNPFYIVLNLAVGGNYTGILNAAGITAPLPGKMEIDYIKLFQDVTHNETLVLAGDDAPEGNYGIFTDNTVVNDKVAFGAGADLFLWNNITPITAPAPAPFEGSNVWAFRALNGNWFGLGVANDAKNMSNYANGTLKFHMKTSSTATFKVGIATDNGEGWVMFNGSNGEHGLVRDGQWHQVTIPVTDFALSDLSITSQLFMLAGDAPAAPVDFYLDNIYYTGGVSGNPAPKVAITNLANDTVFTTPSTIPIQTNASDPNGSISKVTFYSSDNYLATVTTPPFNYNWQTSTPGVYQLTVKATDNQNKTTTSKPVTVLVTRPGNTAPAISITSPTASTPYRKPAKVNIVTNIVDDGVIYKVEFYNGNNLLGTINKAPFQYSWANVDQGTYTIKAKVFDNGKLSNVSAPVTFTVRDNKILSDQFGIYTNNAAITDKLTYGIDANLFVWNNLTVIPGATPQEGPEVIAFRAAAGNWFGLGASHDVRDLSHFSNGFLKFWFKTSYQGSFKFSIISANGQKDILYGAGEQKLGLLRDGQWHQVIVPVNTLTGLDLTTITQAFTFSGDAPAAAADFFIDNIYYSTTNSENPVKPNLALNKPTTTSADENAGTPGPYAVDGNKTTTRWSTPFGEGPHWIYADLGAVYNIKEVKITWEAASAKNYEIQVSNNKVDWAPLKTIVNNTTLENNHTGLTGSGRYLRVYCTARNTVYGYSIYELEVYGDSPLARTGSVLVSDKSGLHTGPASWNVRLHANPVAEGQLRLSSNAALKQLNVLDFSGKIRNRKLFGAGNKVVGVYTLDVSMLPSGIYLLQLWNTKQEQQVVKFIKQ
jgi:beta-glucanase (GH16 family)